MEFKNKINALNPADKQRSNKLEDLVRHEIKILKPHRRIRKMRLPGTNS